MQNEGTILREQMAELQGDLAVVMAELNTLRQRELETKTNVNRIEMDCHTRLSSAEGKVVSLTMENVILWAKLGDQQAQLKKLTEQQNIHGTSASMLKTKMDLMLDERINMDTKFKGLEARVKTNEKTVYLYGGVISDSNHGLEDVHTLCHSLHDEVEKLASQQDSTAADVATLETRLNFAEHETINQVMKRKFKRLEKRVKRNEQSACLHGDLLLDMKHGVDGAKSLYDDLCYNCRHMAINMNDMTTAVDDISRVVEAGATKVLTNAHLLEATMAVVRALVMSSQQGNRAPGPAVRRHAVCGEIVDYVAG